MDEWIRSLLLELKLAVWGADLVDVVWDLINVVDSGLLSQEVLDIALADRYAADLNRVDRTKSIRKCSWWSGPVEPHYDPAGVN